MNNSSFLLKESNHPVRSLVLYSTMPEKEPLPHNILFKKYEVGRLIGCGTFAKVYHGRELLSGHSVAIKVINKKKLSNVRLIDNMKREISIMSRLNHPYIVKLYEVLATKTKIFLVMEFAKCGELFAKVAKGRFSEDLSRKYFQQLISALAYCHARGVFHRDLKPENLMIDENGNMKVADFGLSAVSEQIRPDRLLHTLCGTPAYVAPEVLSKKGYSGAKVDVWSCGIILFVLSAGYLPFNDPNLMAMYKKIYKGEYRCPKWMSNDLKRFLSRLLDTNSERRITIHDIMQDPWFRKGYKEPKLHVEHLKVVKDEPQLIRLNAFDLISFSSGLNLSGFFNHSPDSTDDGKRFLWKESPDKLVEQVEEIARGEGLMIHRMKQWRVDLEQINENMGIAIEVYRLTDKHFVVEARRTGGDSQCYEDFWKKKIRPVLMENES